MQTYTLLLVVFFGSCSVHGAPSRSSEMRISISSGRNLTGQWNAKVLLQHGDNDGRPVVLDINHITTKYDDKEDVFIEATISAPRPRPGSDYEFIPGMGYYKFHSDPVNWFEARKVCQHEGAHLAILNSEAEAKALLRFWVPFPKIFTNWRNDWAHIGVHDLYTEGSFLTIFDVPLNETGYKKWNPSDPNGGVISNCLSVKRNYGTLADNPCSETLPFFCEQEL